MLRAGPLRIDPRRAITLRHDARLFARAVERFVRKHGPAASDRIVRKVAFDVDREIVVSLNGGTGLPKRIDTGRYRAAWAVAIEAVAGRPAGPTTLSPSRDESGRFTQGATARAGDGESRIDGHGLTRAVTVINNVEYGPYVEYGTARMAAGLHRAAALAKVGKDLARRVGPELARAWRS